MIYTIGHKENYLTAIAESKNGTIKKLGKREPNMRAELYPNGYPGGYAFLTKEDAERRIAEDGQIGKWTVFGLDADWENDTEPSPDGWWHNLLRDATIVVLEESADKCEIPPPPKPVPSEHPPCGINIRGSI